MIEAKAIFTLTTESGNEYRYETAVILSDNADSAKLTLTKHMRAILSEATFVSCAMGYNVRTSCVESFYMDDFAIVKNRNSV